MQNLHSMLLYRARPSWLESTQHHFPLAAAEENAFGGAPFRHECAGSQGTNNPGTQLCIVMS